MATRTRTTNRVRSAAPEYKSKSDHVRALLESGSSVATAAKTVGIGYAFAYGIAKRAGLAESAANRRKVRRVQTLADGSVIVQTAAGPITVHADGTVVKPKGNRRVMAPTD